MIDEEDESLLSLADEEKEREPIVEYISSQSSEIKETKRRKLDTFVLDLTRSRKRFKSDLIWSVKHIPQMSSELTLHPKKIKDLRSRLHDIIYNKTNKRVLVVNGPSGSGKSISVKLLCNELMNEKRQSSKLLSLGNDRLDNLVEFSYLTDSYNSVEYFRDYLNECKMLTGENEKCVIIEELPNIYHRRTHESFQNALRNWMETSQAIRLPPLIICITEYDIENEYGNALFNIENTFKVETVLGPKIMELENLQWERVTFNQVAKTYMKKALVNVLSKEGIQRDDDLNSKIDEICQLGDLRNGINVLEYYEKFFKGIEREQVLGKETGFELFHSIGKLIYGSKHKEEELLNFKKRMNLDSLLTDSKMADFDSNMLTSLLVSESTSGSLTKVNLCCLENYVLQSGDGQLSHDVCEMINTWSVVDTMVRQGGNDSRDSLSLFSCLSTRLAMEKCNTRKHGNKKMVFARDSKAMKKKRLVQFEINGYLQRRRNRLLKSHTYSHLTNVSAILYDGFYQASIMDSFKQRQVQFLKGRSIVKVPRLGGEFNTISAEKEFQVLDLKSVEDEYYGTVDIQEDEADDFADDPLEDTDDEFSDDDQVLRPTYPDDTFSDDDL